MSWAPSTTSLADRNEAEAKMASMGSATERVASLGHIEVQGTFYRHAAPGRDALAGGLGGRWGASFPVIYLGQPEVSVVVEAYRHLVDDAGVPAEHVRPRTLYTVPVRVTRILDIRTAEALAGLELSSDDLATEVGDYGRCQEIAAAAHQLRLHGIIAPAAHGFGTTLALFRERLPLAEVPVPATQSTWERLPADPRKLRALKPPATSER
jgi:hypothetical protein